MQIGLESIRDCLEGGVPSTLATVAPDGVPNVTHVSEVHFVDPSHVATSFQFFNKTRANILVTRRATALVIDPGTAAQYRLDLEYERTEDAGPLFESMKAKLAGIASHTGMTGIFRLLGSDVYRVLEVERVSGVVLPTPARQPPTLSAMRGVSETLGKARDLGTLLDQTLAALESHLGIRHSMILIADGAARKLYIVGSRGYPESGVGSEIAFGCGVVGVAAEQEIPIRISHMSAEYSYRQAIRDSLLQEGLGDSLETAIPFPGLENASSQMAVPIRAMSQLVGVLMVESRLDLSFGYAEEDALATIVGQLGASIQALRHAAEVPEMAVTSGRDVPNEMGPGHAVEVRHYGVDDSVFIDDDYLIKGVAGAIFTKLLRENARTGRTEFSNRELRLDPSLGLPEITDNLEARLVLLSRRLVERNSPMRIERTSRGRFRLDIGRSFRMSDK